MPSSATFSLCPQIAQILLCGHLLSIGFLCQPSTSLSFSPPCPSKLYSPLPENHSWMRCQTLSSQHTSFLPWGWHLSICYVLIFSPTRLWVPLGAGTPCYFPLFPCLMLSLGNREFGQRPPLCSHVHYLFLSCALSASVVLALLFRPVCSIPIPAWSPRCLLCSWHRIVSLNSPHGFSSQPSEIEFPWLCPFTTVCHYIVDHIRFIKYVLIHHHNSSLIMVLVSVFLCLVGWFFFFSLCYIFCIAVLLPLPWIVLSNYLLDEQTAYPR